jgi:hypothetical protein
MREDFRLFTCALCRSQVRICSHCDRGQIYCSKRCAARRRKESMDRAGARYQRTPRGRRKHAAREACRRARCAAARVGVTHQGTPPASRRGMVAPMRDQTPYRPVDKHSHPTVWCDVCGHPCRPFARSSFIRARRRAGGC